VKETGGILCAILSGMVLRPVAVSVLSILRSTFQLRYALEPAFRERLTRTLSNLSPARQDEQRAVRTTAFHRAEILIGEAEK
jgi:hypothetical protein